MPSSSLRTPLRCLGGCRRRRCWYVDDIFGGPCYDRSRPLAVAPTSAPAAAVAADVAATAAATAAADLLAALSGVVDDDNRIIVVPPESLDAALQLFLLLLLLPLLSLPPPLPLTVRRVQFHLYPRVNPSGDTGGDGECGASAAAAAAFQPRLDDAKPALLLPLS